MLNQYFFCNDTATTEIYTLSLHDALPISPDPGADLLNDGHQGVAEQHRPGDGVAQLRAGLGIGRDRKSTRLNSSHQIISYAVFCLKKKKTVTHQTRDN